MSLDVNLLERSFALVKGNGAEFSTLFYATLFGDYPAVQPLFANTDLKTQGDKLFASLVLVVDNLKNPEALENALKGLGTSHVKYGVLPEHYPFVGASLLKTFAKSLAPADWTSEVHQAWTDAYGAVTQLMLEGADYSPEILMLSTED